MTSQNAFRKIVFAAASLALAASLVSNVRAEAWVKYEAQPGSKVKFDGTSTIHDWTVESAIIGGFMELEATADAELKSMKVKPKVEVVIPVRSKRQERL